MGSLEYVERHIRQFGELSQAERRAAEILYAYRLNRFTTWGKDIMNITRSYPSSTEVPIIEDQDDEPKVIFRR